MTELHINTSNAPTLIKHKCTQLSLFLPSMHLNQIDCFLSTYIRFTTTAIWNKSINSLISVIHLQLKRNNIIIHLFRKKCLEWKGRETEEK